MPPQYGQFEETMKKHAKSAVHLQLLSVTAAGVMCLLPSWLELGPITAAHQPRQLHWQQPH
jgi:hypothetical protein